MWFNRIILINASLKTVQLYVLINCYICNIFAEVWVEAYFYLLKLLKPIYHLNITNNGHVHQ